MSFIIKPEQLRLHLREGHVAPVFFFRKAVDTKHATIVAGFTDIDLVAHQPNLFVGGTVSEAAELFMAMNSIQRLLREANVTLEERVLQHMREGLKDYRQDAGVYMKSACWLISAKPQS